MTRAKQARSPLRHLLAIDEREAVISFAQKPLGKLVLFASVLFLLLLPPVAKRLDPPLWVLLLVGAAAAHAYLPKYRRPVLFVSTWLIAFLSLPASLHGFASLAILMVCCWGSLQYVQRYKTHLYARRPVVTLLAILALLTALASALPRGTVQDLTWSFVTVSSVYIWFLSYAIMDQRSRHAKPITAQMGVLRPFWVDSSNPIGKGAFFLKKHLAANPRDLAVTQLKGLKLLLWMDMLLALEIMVHWVFIGRLGIPTQPLAVTAFLNHQPYPIAILWISSIVDTTMFTLNLAVVSHKIVGIARLAGFRLPRNMCQPLASRTLGEFWNRYNFYFKEVMVDFFYVPTFLKMFKNHPRLRMFFATFMAAGVGNLVFHFIRDLPDIHLYGLWKTIESYSAYAFYCTVLATGIGISQLRQHAGFKPAPTVVGRICSFIVIWSFIVTLQNFDVTMRDFTFLQLIGFTASLFGIR